MKLKMKKKGKTKASSNKASLAKLANKRTNRLAKQGKLHKVDKKKKKKKALQEKADKRQQQLQQEQQLSLKNNNNGIYEEEEEDDDYISDEDTEYFKHLKNAKAFATADLDTEAKPRSRKRKRPNSDDEEEDYEQQPRSFAADKDAQNMKGLLPIIDKGKVIKRMVKKEDIDEIESPRDTQNGAAEEKENQNDEEMSENGAEEELDEKAYLASLSTAELFAYRKNKLIEKKQRIAALSHAVLEDPQNNMKKLKELRLMLGDSDLGVSLTVRKYAMTSLMEVFKDIVPGYRLRIPTDKEKSQRVKKETKSLWDYEASFLLSYKVYLEFLETMAKGKPVPEKSFLTKHGIKDLELPQTSRLELAKLALKCFCEMLVNHPHFNYRSNVITSLVPFTNHRNKEFSEIACDAVKQVFKQDKTGEVTLEIVRSIGRMIKQRKYDVRREVLDTFLVLKIKEIDLSSTDEKYKKMKRKEKMLKLSRRERKRMKQKEHLEKELLETKASASRQQKLKQHTEIIQAVFETYIRVIKLAADSALLPSVLEGLAKFAHLINVEYFDSLFAAFNTLIESGKLTNQEMLHCMQTAFTILSGQGSVINIDPASFYKHFYCTLPSVHAGSSSETAVIVLECLNSMINKRRKQLSQQRILAFIKRLCSLCLQQAPEAAIAFLAAVRQFIHTYKYSDALFDSDVQGSGVYLPYLDDPEHCCANSTSLWELHLMRHHCDPVVQKYAKHMIKMAPLAGEYQLPQDLARKSPKDLYEMISSREIFHDQIPEKSPRKKKLKTTGFQDQDFGDYVSRVLDSVPSFKLQENSLTLSNDAMDTS